MTHVDTAADPYTLWWVIFNNPEDCSDPCDEDDLFVREVDAAVIWGSGSITPEGGSGVMNESTRIVAGNLPEGMCCFGALARNNGFGALVLLVVDEHPGFDDYIVDLTSPEVTHRVAAFPPMPPSE